MIVGEAHLDEVEVQVEVQEEVEGEVTHQQVKNVS